MAFRWDFLTSVNEEPGQLSRPDQPFRKPHTSDIFINTDLPSDLYALFADLTTSTAIFFLCLQCDSLAIITARGVFAGLIAGAQSDQENP